MKKLFFIFSVCLNFQGVFPQENVKLLDLYNEARKLLCNNLYRMDNKYSIFDCFGFQPDPFTGRIHFSDHVLVASKGGDKVYSISDGEILEIGYDPLWFKTYIKIKTNNFEITYGNLVEINNKVGDKINEGQIIGIVGRGVDPYGNVIIFRIRYKNIPLNPRLVLTYDNNRSYPDYYE